MKAKLEKVNEKPKFEPLKLVIEIESEEELAALYARFNVNPDRIPESMYPRQDRSLAGEGWVMDAFNSIQGKVKEVFGI